MSAMEKMLASMMGITAEEMQETAKRLIELASNGATALEAIQNDVAEIKAYLLMGDQVKEQLIENDPSICIIEDNSNGRQN